MEYPIEMPKGWVLQSSGSTWWGERRLFERLSALSDEERAVLFERVCREAYELHLAGLREQDPGASEEQLHMRAAARRIGRAAVLRITGIDPGEG